MHTTWEGDLGFPNPCGRRKSEKPADLVVDSQVDAGILLSYSTLILALHGGHTAHFDLSSTRRSYSTLILALHVGHTAY
ncbi:hypothetical protein RRG08_037538 [Elysia crispata]|uniref:Uncharacterized protein n=1 Tax=Elysia crispata TaxID=231223 RepID=A0AAE1DSE8_9GAST|nr:hypothetical protein RRG08_037538 [Elysia crispata]